MGGRFSVESSDPSSVWDEYFQPQSLDSLYSHQDDILSPPQQNAPSPPPPLPRQRDDPPPPRPENSYEWSLEHVIEAFAAVTLGASNFIVGIDFTKSNEWTGARTFNGKSLHHIEEYCMNPYEKAISVVSKTLTPLDGDTYVYCFGFGDVTTTDQDVFTFNAGKKYCNGFEGVLNRYREIVPRLSFAGPTSFCPIIEMATTIVEQSYGQFHVLLIIADGQVTRSVDIEPCDLSPQEQRTFQAIVEASNYPLSIVLIGVGDGPWDKMEEFEKNIPSRPFNNFRFVNFTKIMSKNVVPRQKEAEFARSVLMEIPSQYKAMIELDLVGGRSPQRVPLPPPIHVPSVLPSYKPPKLKSVAPSAPPESSSSSYDRQICPICYTEDKDMAFGCGHQTCCECGEDLETCPICRRPINLRIKLY